MSSSAITTQVAQLKAGNIQNQADSSSIYSAGVWSFKNSTAVASVTISDAGAVTLGPSGFTGNHVVNGNVGIGTASPSTSLHLRKTTAADVYLRSQNSLADAYYGASADGRVLTWTVSAQPLVFGTNDTERMRIDASGNLGIGIVPSARLEVNGSIKALAYTTRSGGSGSYGTNGFNIYWTGGTAQLWIDSTNVGTLAFTSDYRIKKNVETQELPALERISQLRPVKYEFADYKEMFKADGVQREGFIAHELQAVIPSAVEGEKDAEDQIQSLKLDALCSVMVKAIQEQQAQIEALKAEVAALKAP